MLSAAALSLLTTTDSGGAARNRALAIWQATTTAGATAGIVAGGAEAIACRREHRASECGEMVAARQHRVGGAVPLGECARGRREERGGIGMKRTERRSAAAGRDRCRL